MHLRLPTLSAALLISSGALLSAQETPSPSPTPEPVPVSNVRSLVEAERAFARMAIEKNMRDAFVANLAEDAIGFEKEPVKAMPKWKARKPNTVQLIWEPTFAGIASSGDLGYTNGPSSFKASPDIATPEDHGYFLSIWKKQADGAWKVALDIGFQTPVPKGEQAPLRTLTLETPRAPIPAREAHVSLDRAENDLIAGSKQDASAALTAVAANEIQVFREGVFAAQGKATAELMLSADRATLKSSENAGSGLSAAGDLGYFYGTYSVERMAGKETGCFVRIWKREPTGKWRVVVDARKKTPEKKEPAKPAATPAASPKSG